MNNFNNVFVAIKNYCAENRSEHASTQAIASRLHMRIERIEFYVNCLVEIGMLRYSENGLVALTDTGKKRAEVFV